MLDCRVSLHCTSAEGEETLTLMPSNRDRARRGLSARRVLRDLMAPRSEYPMALATMLTTETYDTVAPNVRSLAEETQYSQF